MCKYFFVIWVLLIWGEAVFSQTLCAKGHGKVITGINNTQYCLSPMQMNWWSANAWCDAAGMKLVDTTKDCDCTGYEGCKFESACPNLATGYSGTTGKEVWSGVPNGKSGAYMVRISNGSIYAEPNRVGGARYCALCK